MSTCQRWPRPTTRQAPNAPDSSNGVPPPARAMRARGLLGVAGHDDVQVGGVAAEQAVADRAADDPGRLVADAGTSGLERLAHS